MNEQLSFFEPVAFWIAEVDTGCRMWKCPGCLGRVVGDPMRWKSRNYTSYKFCPYCGLRLFLRSEEYYDDLDLLLDSDS